MIKIKISNKAHSNDFDTKLLEPKDSLFPDFWDNHKLNPKIAERLLTISENIVKHMDIDVEIEDIVITGSIASYNWHKMSDIDLHIMLDFEKIDKNFTLVKKMLDQSRINWNKTHDIFISGKEVELYFQDINEPHESNGIWSLKKESWLAEPVLLDPNLDLKTSEKKAESIAKAIDHVSDLIGEKKYESAYNYASKIKEKVSRMRTAGLEREGIYSPENLAFKMLRNSNYLEMLSSYKVDSYDKMMSLNSPLNEVKDYFNKYNDPEYMKFDEHPNSSIEKILNDEELAPWEFNNNT